MNIKEMLITNNRPYKKLIPKGIVIHWTANTDKGANAIANRNYFQNHPEAQASAHYVVDDTNIIRCIPESEVAWHVGAKTYTQLKYNLFGNENPNNYLIGIEMCVNSDGNWNKTYQNTIELVVDILKKYNLTIDNIYRHFDITGKDCPRMMSPFVSGGNEAWNKFKKDILKEVDNMEKVTIQINDKKIDGYLIGDKSYAPLRDLIDLLNRTVEWDNATQTVIIK